MRSKAQIAGHPLHPMLIGIPVGGFVITLVLDIVHLAIGAPAWWQATIPVIAISIVGALIAAIPGLIDLFGVAIKQGATKQGVAHMLLNLVLVGLFIGNLVARLNAGAPPDRPDTAFWLTVAGIGVMAISGWLGWVMVQTYHVGVWEHPDAKDPDPRLQEPRLHETRTHERAPGPFPGEPILP